MVRKLKKGFTLLEVMLSMMIFSIIGFSLYQLLDSVTNFQTNSLGSQHFKVEGYEILDRIEKQIQDAVSGEEYAFKRGILIITEGSSHTEKEKLNIEFKCITPATGQNYYYEASAKSGVQQLYFTKHEYNNDINADTLENRILASQNKFSWTDVRLKESVIFLTKSSDTNPDCIVLYGKNEQIIDGNINYVDGIADTIPLQADDSPSALISVLGNNITEIQYYFWGNSNRSWNDDGVTGQPITAWDSTVAANNVHTINQLPLAMKIILTLTYNPEQYHKKTGDLNVNKNQRMVFEKVVYFKNRNNA